METTPPLRNRTPLALIGRRGKPFPPPGEVPTQPWPDAEIATAKGKCIEALSKLKLNYEPLPPIKQGLCGAPAPILLKSLGSDPALSRWLPVCLLLLEAGCEAPWLWRERKAHPLQHDEHEKCSTN